MQPTPQPSPGATPGRRAIVIGGSLGSLFAANLLHRQGWDVHVYERVGDDLAARGAGIGTHEELFSTMARLGIPIDDTIGIPVEERLCLDATGRVVHTRPHVTVMSAWARVYRPLKDILPADRYHFGMTCARVVQAGHEVTAHFQDGSSATADLLIGADGIRSTVRAQFFPEAQPAYAGYVAWRGVVDEAALSDEVRARYFERYMFGLPPGEQMVCYPVPGRGNDVRAGHRAYNFVWYRPTDEATLRDICTDATGRHHALGIPPPLIRPEIVAGVKRRAHATFAPQIAGIVESSQPFFQAIFDVESPRLVAGRVVLLGDAAFVARPHVGMGVTKAALDAVCLADTIAQHGADLDAALAAYDRARTEFGRRVVARARRLGAYIEARMRPERTWTAEELDQSPERVLREVGAKLATIRELQFVA